MQASRGIRTALWVVLLLSGGAIASLDDPPAKPKEQARLPDQGDAFSLESILVTRGYFRVDLHRGKVPYLRLKVSIDGKDADLVLDTAAPGTHLDVRRTGRNPLKLRWIKLPALNGDAEQDPLNMICELQSFRIGSLLLPTYTVRGYDLTEINRRIEAYGDPPVDGVLGADLLAKHQAVLDYSTLSMFLKKDIGKSSILQTNPKRPTP
jgi:hypothetical protein